ncbi:AAA family ATPase [Waterburya agarophytonicola K14]|uniref:AAA family ATPase n=1 Tax=Waterburya agarophytonicola KI4 TaxID=2874699 RepID=A0A964FFV7_9CYAN|nr:AAA family ATPase [Waterburya agarophytonicola]MCC0178255.1 AAA family ATPase [Waterburya agarophytonicola KI4]
MKFITEVFQGATPSIDEFVLGLGDRIPQLKEYKSTPQDPEWHAEGDVHIHVGMVLDETYKILETEATHLSKEDRLSLILGALLHDIAKPQTTKQQEIQGIVRTVAPRHASKGRSYLAPKLMGLGLPYDVVETTLGLVGYHHDPKQLVTNDKPSGKYKRIARLANPELLYWLELADIRGRECQDKQQQLNYIEMYRMFAQEYQAWERCGAKYQAWREYFHRELQDWDLDTRDLVFSRAIARWEAGEIFTPESEIARSYSYRNAFPQVVVTFGVSGSGKSTWIANNFAEHTVVSLDNLRQQIATSRSDQSQNSKVVQLAKEQLKALLRSNSKIVWDATNIRRDFRQQVINLSRNYGALVTLVIFHCSEDIYFQRNKERHHSIPDNVLVRQIEQMEFPELDEGDRTLIVDEQGNTLATYGSYI